MTKFVFAKDVAQASSGAKSVLVIAPKAMWTEKRFPKVLPARARRVALEVADDTKPGDHGTAASSLTGATPRRVIAGVLPDKVSRYNSPTRAEGIHRIVASAGLGKDPKSAIIIVLEDPSHATAALNAVGRAFPIYSAKSEVKKTDPRISIAFVNPQGKAFAPSAEAKASMDVTRSVAALVDTPPTEMNPEALAKAARALLADVPRIKFKEIIGDDLLAAGLGGIHGVGRCALKKPRLFIASYTPESKSDTHVALVGKGVTFDTGGLHIKARGMMETMKCDMGGAAAVLGAFRLLTQFGSKQRISLVLCLAENAIGPDAFKPDDILKLHSGKTVEINNTDAEGRLLLGDGVSYAVRELGADIVFDAATLTGAQLIATGTMHGAVMSNDADLEAKMVSAGQRTGDLVHPLPFAPEFYKAEFKSPVADMRNSVKDRTNAQTSCAGQFIYNHIEDTAAKWVHLDLAGPAFRNDRGTGYGVSVIAEAVRSL